MTEDCDDGRRVWLVERTFDRDKPYTIVLIYATTDGERYFEKERSLTGFSGDRLTTAAVDVDKDHLGTVEDDDRRKQYAAEATRMSNVHDPDDPI